MGWGEVRMVDWLVFASAECHERVNHDDRCGHWVVQQYARGNGYDRDIQGNVDLRECDTRSKASECISIA